MTETVIGLDLDDVLIDCNRSLCAFHNAYYGTSLTLQDFTTYRLEDVFSCGTDEMKKRIREFVSSGYHHQTQPVTGATEAVMRLYDEYTLWVITARPYEQYESTVAWLDTHFPYLKDRVYFTDQDSPGTKKPKSDICAMLEAV